MDKQRLQKLAGILKEHVVKPVIVKCVTVEYNGETYNLVSGIGFPYDNGKIARKFSSVAKKLKMKQGPDYEFGYERGDVPEVDYPSYIKIHNPIMQCNEIIRKLVMKCLEQYDEYDS